MESLSDEHPTLPLPAIRVQELVPLSDSDTQTPSPEEEPALVQDATPEAGPAARIVVGAVVELWEMLAARQAEAEVAAPEVPEPLPGGVAQAAAAQGGLLQSVVAPDEVSPGAVRPDALAGNGIPVQAAAGLSVLGDDQTQVQAVVLGAAGAAAGLAQQAEQAQSAALFAGAAPRVKPSRNLPPGAGNADASIGLNPGNLDESGVGPGDDPGAGAPGPRRPTIPAQMQGPDRHAGMSHLPTQRPLPPVEAQEDTAPVVVPVPVPLSMPSAPPAAAVNHAVSGADTAQISYDGDGGSDFLIPGHTSHRGDDGRPRRFTHVTVGVLVGTVAVAAVVVGGVIFTSSPSTHTADPLPSSTGLVIGPTVGGSAGPTFVADGRDVAGQSAAPGHASVTPTPTSTLGATPSAGASGGVSVPTPTPTVAPKVVTTTKPPAPNPFTITASTYSSSNSVGTQTTTDTGGGQNVGWIVNGSWVAYNGVTFPAGLAGTVKVRMASQLTAANIGSIQFRLNSPNGPVFASLTVNGTGGWQNWITVATSESPIPAGTYTLYVTFSTNTGGGFVNVNWFQFG
ncbi:MAG TPA: carbohydrate-binding protein [Actinocrinis sp.]|nr:carbohydrate-binding protein [Actinocrinis sp.]